MSDGGTLARLPAHLRKYVVRQNSDRYTPEDQATWRFIMRQLREFLGVHAHPSYLEGLSKTGITIDQIPRIEDVDRRLNDFGWGAVPVSGFIPPAAFMELQSLGVLPIASDVRSVDHWLYTPAPDIIHEAAGHAPLLIHPGYSDYLRRYGEVARHTLIAQEDLDQYEAIRILSDLKEDARSTPAQLAEAERRFAAANAAAATPSEAALLSRMNWWTAEYGLIGPLDKPRLFGAGLLSSVGEARTCLEDRVAKIPLSVDCVNFAYDITEPQPHLFVTPDFETLSAVLDQLADRLAYRRGGAYGLDEARRARTVNTVVLDSGVQISGRVEGYLTDRDQPAYLRFAGPCQLSLDYQQLPGQGVLRHAHGFSCPVGTLKDGRPLDPANLGKRLEFASGVTVEGRVKHVEVKNGRPLYVTWADCTVARGSERLFEPAWGEYDMVIGERVTSVFGGPADRETFGDDADFAAKTIPPRTPTPGEAERFAIYSDLRAPNPDYDRLLERYSKLPGDPWLIGLELLELAARRGRPAPELERKLDPATRTESTVRLALMLGRRLIPA